MLSDETKKVVLGNVQLLRYCEQKNISINKLRKCNIERMDDKFFFVMTKNNGIEPTLENDIATQPDVVLIMHTISKVFDFETTEWTSKIFGDKEPERNASGVKKSFLSEFNATKYEKVLRNDARTFTIFEYVSEGDASIERGTEKMDMSISDFIRAMKDNGFMVPKG